MEALLRLRKLSVLIKILENLFDCLISTILLNCSEVWAVFCSLKDSDPFENLHLKFIKVILGFHCIAPNDACW